MSLFPGLSTAGDTVMWYATSKRSSVPLVAKNKSRKRVSNHPICSFNTKEVIKTLLCIALLYLQKIRVVEVRLFQNCFTETLTVYN